MNVITSLHMSAGSRENYYLTYLRQMEAIRLKTLKQAAGNVRSFRLICCRLQKLHVAFENNEMRCVWEDPFANSPNSHLSAGRERAEDKSQHQTSLYPPRRCVLLSGYSQALFFCQTHTHTHTPHVVISSWGEAGCSFRLSHPIMKTDSAR